MQNDSYLRVLASCLALAACAVPEEPGPAPGASEESIAESQLTLAQKRPITDEIKARASTRGITNPLLLAGVPNHETGLVQCFKDATFHCPGPQSNFCGGPVLAGSGDGPCGNRQGGLGMYQFDAGTHAQTLATYGNGILELSGNIDQGINVILQKLKVCPNLSGVDTDAQAIAFLNAATPGTPRFEDFLTTMAWCYNGCPPGSCSLHQSRRNAYRAGVTQLLDGFGPAYWFTSSGGGGGSRALIVSRPGDFNGDGKDDIITFTRGEGADVFVSPSTGNGFLGAGVWHPFWAPGAPDAEIPSVGDFNGDGKDDIVTFTRGDRADVLVALSNGTSFGGAQLWHDFFAINGEVPTVGDFNGDGKDDIIVFTRGEGGDVHVALSTGTSFVYAGIWNDFFAIRDEVPAIGDFNGDGKDDIAVFTRGERADVLVSLSTGTGFTGAGLWHDFFALNGELPVVADFNGDGRSDIATFKRGNGGDVLVALSTGVGFTGAGLWNDFFSLFAELPGAGDFDGDGKADIVTFTRGANADVHVARSTGAGFAGASIWNDFFAPGGETPMPATDVR